jgi:hypothetical protein
MPLITAGVVEGLAHPELLAEIDAIAVVPEWSSGRDRPIQAGV